jgi:hypothetical protein
MRDGLLNKILNLPEQINALSLSLSLSPSIIIVIIINKSRFFWVERWLWLALTLAELIRRSSQVEEIYFSGWDVGKVRVG